MKNITVSVDDDTYRKARIRAAERDTSVSALVRLFLNEIASGGSALQQLKRDEVGLRASMPSFRGGDRVPRDDIHLRLADASFADWDDPEAERAFRDF